MVFKDLVHNMREILSRIQADLSKAEGGNKAASQRVRTGTVKLEKLAKRYRKDSIGIERSGKSKRPAKKASKAKTTHKAVKPKAAKSKGRSSSASVNARSLSVKRSTAKLPTAKRLRWS